MKNISKMMFLLLIFIIILQNNSNSEECVYVCQGNYAYAYHSDINCWGINNCKKEKVVITFSEAKSNYRKSCGICWNGPIQCVTGQEGASDMSSYSNKQNILNENLEECNKKILNLVDSLNRLNIDYQKNLQALNNSNNLLNLYYKKLDYINKSDSIRNELENLDDKLKKISTNLKQKDNSLLLKEKYLDSLNYATNRKINDFTTEKENASFLYPYRFNFEVSISNNYNLNNSNKNIVNNIINAVFFYRFDIKRGYDNTERINKFGIIYNYTNEINYSFNNVGHYNNLGFVFDFKEWFRIGCLYNYNYNNSLLSNQNFVIIPININLLSDGFMLGLSSNVVFDKTIKYNHFNVGLNLGYNFNFIRL